MEEKVQQIRYLLKISCACQFFQWRVVLWNFIPSEHIFLCGFFVSNSLERCNCENNYWHNIKPLNTVWVGEILSTLGLENKGPIQAWAGGPFQRKKRSFDLTILFAGFISGKYAEHSTPPNFHKWGLLVFLQYWFQTLFHICYFSFLFAYYCSKLIHITFKTVAI